MNYIEILTITKIKQKYKITITGTHRKTAFLIAVV